MGVYVSLIAKLAGLERRELHMTRDELSNFIQNAIDQYWKITLVSVFAQIALVITIVMADTEGYELLLSVSIAVAALIQVIAGDSSLLNASVASSDLQNDEEFMSTDSGKNLRKTPWGMFRVVNTIMPGVIALLAILTLYEVI
tara:strand:- start:466 stop:894 length:429 start_codon:yes stop_codon:yes gene_type:complete